MIIDMRYHIVSLVAVFLALGIGILVGTGMMRDGTLISEQKSIIDRLERDFGEARHEKEDLRRRLNFLEQELKASQEFEEMALATLAKDLLAGKRVAIIRTGNSIDTRAYEKIVSALKAAGAEVRSTTSILRAFKLGPGDSREEIANCLGMPTIATQDIPGKLAIAVADQVALGTSLTFFPALEELDFIQSSGHYGGLVAAVIIMGGSKDGTQSNVREVDIAIIKRLKTLGVTTVGVEALGAEVSYMRHYKQEYISTVDNVDTVLGQITLVYVLAGKKGNFGIKETAKRAIPDIFR